MDSYIGLFYPKPTFQDDWIKLAALYWDRIGRLKWKHPFWQDSDVIKQLIGELGFIVDYAPSDEDISSVSSAFAQMLNENRDVLLEHYGMRGFQLNLIPEEFMTTDLFKAMLNAKLSEPQPYFRVPMVPNSDLVVVPHQDIFQTARVSSEMLFLYTGALAERIASTQQLFLVTEQAFDQVASSGLSIKRLIQAELPSDDSLPHLVSSLPSSDEIENYLATISLRSVLPKDIASVSVNQIIKLRSRYRDELIAYLQSHFHNPIISAVAGVSAVVFGIYPVIQAKKRKEVDIRKSSPMAYLLSLEKDLELAQATTRIFKAGEKFFPHII